MTVLQEYSLTYWAYKRAAESEDVVIMAEIKEHDPQ